MTGPSSPRFPSQVATCVPHERLLAAEDLAPDTLDLCTGQNPYGPPAYAIEAACQALCARYLDPSAGSARRSVAERFGLDPDQVLIGHGATELAFSCARALASSPCVWLSIEPAESECSAAARRAGARIMRWRSVERTGHRVDLEQVAELIRLERPSVVSLCAPGSPTGASVPFARLRALAEQFPETRFVVEQSWLSLSDDHADLELAPTANMICIRSLSLDFALPGARAGYAVASPALIGHIDAARSSYTANAAAQAIVQLAMRDKEFVASSRRALQADRARLAGVLDTLGLHYTPSVAPFLLLRIARAEEVALELFEEHHIAVSDATRFGLPDHIRISAVSASAAPRLQAALAHVTQRRGLVAGREA
ncbi:MAG: aminotransferase class I/II-fold pyridoxal phosphate-dependent enzyme [Polyangiales bacterium]